MTAKRLYFLMIGLCAVLALSIGAGVYYGDKLLATQAERIAKARADEELVDQKKRIKKDLETKIEELGEVQELAVKFLPDSKNQDILIAELIKIAKNNDVELGDISFDSSDEPTQQSQTEALEGTKGVLVFPFNAKTGTMSFDQLINFLTDVELNRRKMQVTNITISPIDERENPDYGKLNVSELRIEVYLKGNETPPVTPAAPADTAPAD